MKPILPVFATTLLLAANQSLAAQVVVDFETLALGTDLISLSSYQIDGFSLTSDVDPLFQDDAFIAWGTADEGYTGSVALFNQYSGSQTTLTMVAPGQTFRLSTVDLAPAIADGGVGATVQFRAVQADGTHLTGDCSFGDSLAFSTCVLPTSFTNLVSVAWTQGDIPHQFDNLTLTTPVPEPTEAAMLVVGLALLAKRRRDAKRPAGASPQRQ